MAKNTSILEYPAPAQNWNEANPLGNGRMGVMVSGDLGKEVLQVNEEGLWSGFSRDDNNYQALAYLKPVRQAIRDGHYYHAQELADKTMLGINAETFQPLGNLEIQWHGESQVGDCCGYLRSLDLDRGLWQVRYQISNPRIGDGVQHVHRRCFVSAVDQVIVYQWFVTGQGAEESRWQVGMTSPHPGTQINLVSPGHLQGCGKIQSPILSAMGSLPLRVEDDLGGTHPRPVVYDQDGVVHFSANWMILPPKNPLLPDRGNLNEVKSVLEHQGSTLTIIGALSSTFPGQGERIGRSKKEIEEDSLQRLTAVAELGFEGLLERHLNEHQEALVDCGFSLDPSPLLEQDTCPTCQEEKFLHLGRYLLASSSRNCNLPATLQGIWNPWTQPPWGCGYTTNINTQMNYWPAEVWGLQDCVKPLVRLIKSVSCIGRRTALVHYNCRGWTAHHNIDGWGKTSPSGGRSLWAFWPMAGAWLSRHLWDHYEYSMDTGFLANQAFPVLLEAGLFLSDWFRSPGEAAEKTPGPQGAQGAQGSAEPSGTGASRDWGFNPSSSPEISFLDPQGRPCSLGINSAMDLSLTRELWTTILTGYEDLYSQGAGYPEFAQVMNLDSSRGGQGVGNTEQAVEEIRQSLARLPWPSIGADGSLLEWQNDLPLEEPGHRHFSSLYGLFPGDLFWDKPDFRRACRVTLDQRIAAGSGSTAWSAAWASALYARLGLARESYRMFRRVIDEFTLPNGFTTHPPFQIDGNFGGLAAAGEMLLYSRRGAITLLPALPEAWPAGRVRGLRARGGVTLDLEWKAGALESLQIESSKHQELEITSGERTTKVSLKAGSPTRLDWKDLGGR